MSLHDESRRAHSVRIGFSQYWVYTWADAHGYAWESSSGSGWSTTRYDAVKDATEVLRDAERVEVFA